MLNLTTISPLHAFNRTPKKSQIIYYLKETRCTFWGGKKILFEYNRWKKAGFTCERWAVRPVQSHAFSLHTSFPGSNSTVASPRFSLGKHQRTVNMNEQQQKADNSRVKVHCISFHALSLPARSCRYRPSGGAGNQKRAHGDRVPKPY